jgi:hypothetical protein
VNDLALRRGQICGRLSAAGSWPPKPQKRRAAPPSWCWV